MSHFENSNLFTPRTSELYEALSAFINYPDVPEGREQLALGIHRRIMPYPLATNTSETVLETIRKTLLKFVATKDEFGRATCVGIIWGRSQALAELNRDIVRRGTKRLGALPTRITMELDSHRNLVWVAALELSQDEPNFDFVHKIAGRMGPDKGADPRQGWTDLRAFLLAVDQTTDLALRFVEKLEVALDRKSPMPSIDLADLEVTAAPAVPSRAEPPARPFAIAIPARLEPSTEKTNAFLKSLADHVLQGAVSHDQLRSVADVMDRSTLRSHGVAVWPTFIDAARRPGSLSDRELAVLLRRAAGERIQVPETLKPTDPLAPIYVLQAYHSVLRRDVAPAQDVLRAMSTANIKRTRGAVTPEVRKAFSAIGQVLDGALKTGRLPPEAMTRLNAFAEARAAQPVTSSEIGL